MKHRASPMAAAITPPSAAPSTRAMFMATELRVTAFGRSSAETISEMKLPGRAVPVPRGPGQGPREREPGRTARGWCRQRINGGHHD